MFSQTFKFKLIAVFCGILFAAGIVRLFMLHFEAGRNYPPYSSLRSDPLGTKALFESFEGLPYYAVDRNYHTWNRTPLDSKTTMIISGMRQGEVLFAGKRLKVLLDRLAESNGRLVIALRPPHRSYSLDDTPVDADDCAQVRGDEDVPSGESKTGTGNPDEDSPDKTDTEDRTPIEMLGIDIHTQSGATEEGTAIRKDDVYDILPKEIPWRSSLFFEPDAAHWETLYQRQNKPVVVQRQWGGGTVVVLADSYLLSNEALRNHRSAGLLTWLAVPGHKIVFDEFQKGLTKKTGIAGLTRQYRLHWVFAAVLVIVGLCIWRQATVFVPAHSGQRSSQLQPMAGRDTNQGLVDLSRKNIRTEELLSVCFHTWKTQATKSVAPSRIDEVEQMVLQAATDSRKEIQYAKYIEICELLNQGKGS